ncbi:MAG TPA: pilus assembly protein TadG-related protein [Kofleriaceae bacterium]|nr:pilus assembly protein TadG-related protein [Kofleriaceae bacterium]
MRTSDPRAAARPAALLGDQRGAIAVIGLFAVVFLVGVLYLVLGAGRAIRHQERMQDAADATSFTAAVVHARAMNLIALARMVKLGVATAQEEGGAAEVVRRAADRLEEVLRARAGAIALERARALVLPDYAPPAQELSPWPAPAPLPEAPGGAGEPLGGEGFQLRLVIRGGPLDTLGERGVRTAALMADEDAGRVGALRAALSRVSVAQAEYYFDGPQQEAPMLWHMEWRARLRRVRFPGGALPPELAALSGAWGEWMVH